LPATLVQLAESGPPLVFLASEWDETPYAVDVEQLAARRVVRIMRMGRSVLVEPQFYVGELRGAGWTVRVVPRWPDLYRSLRELVGSRPERLVSAFEGAGTDRRVSEAAEAFARAVRVLLDDGLPLTFHPEVRATSSPRGRILVRETYQRFGMRGVGHLVVVRSSRRTTDVRVAAVVATTWEVLRLSGEADHLELRGLDEVVGLVAGEQAAVSSTEALSLIPEALEEQSDRVAVRNLLLLCRDVLTRESRFWGYEATGPGGQARFCNMVRLWELGILSAFESRLQGGAAAALRIADHPLRRGGLRLFDDGGPELDPDSVVYRSGRSLLVIDAKYSAAGAATASDVYQIVCYVDRLQAAAGLLVYVTDGPPWFETIGHDLNECPIMACGVPMVDAARALGEVANRAIIEATALTTDS